MSGFRINLVDGPVYGLAEVPCDNCVLLEEQVKNLKKLLRLIAELDIKREVGYPVETMDYIEVIERMRNIAKKGLEVEK